MQPETIRSQRIETAARKIERVLRRHEACHQKELERRVCEVGFSYYPKAPPRERPEPVHLTVGRQRLVARDIIDAVPVTIRGNTYNFWHLTDADPEAVARARASKVEATDAFDLLHHDRDLSGFATEQMLWNAMNVAGPFFAVPYHAGRDVTELDGRTSSFGVDLAGVERTTWKRIVVEVKNIREWVYPDSAIIWKLLVAAAELRAVPVLIARRVAEPTFLFLNDVGGYAVPTNNLYIHQDARDRLGWAAFERGAALLGYSDVKVVDPQAPEERYVKLFAERLPRRLTQIADTLDPIRDDVLRYGLTEGLCDEGVRITRASGTRREDAFHEFWTSVKRSERDDEARPHPSEF